MQLRRLLPHESNLYRQLRLECLKNYPENFGSNYDDEVQKEKLFFEAHIEHASLANFVIGAFNNNQLAGIAGFNSFDGEKFKHRGRIIQVYVSPDLQGQQIGSKLIKSAMDEAFKIPAIEQIEIGVLTSNKRAEALYKKLGFNEYGLQKKYSKIGEIYFDHKMLVIFKDQYSA